MRWPVGAVQILVACGREDVAPVEDGCPCEGLALAGPVTTEAALADALAQVRGAVPALDGVEVSVELVPDLAYFRAWAEVDGLLIDDGRARRYAVHVDPVVLSDPMPEAGLVAILLHELGHIADYVAMDSDALLAFVLWYGTQDPASSDELRDYERATDTYALDRGCADGLAEARAWIYAHAQTPEILADKQRNYLGPDEIAAWVDENGECPGP